jgi:hypothetical protein
VHCNPGDSQAIKLAKRGFEVATTEPSVDSNSDDALFLPIEELDRSALEA